MKKFILIISSFFLITTLFSQEQQSETIQQQKITKDLKAGQVENRSAPKYISSKTTNADYPITYSVGRDGVQHVVREEKKLEDFSAETITTVKKQLKELYGTYYEEYGVPNIVFYAEFYERCEFIPLSTAPSGVKNILSLNVMDKYNPENIYHDNLTEFNAGEFNVLKYRINYNNKTAQYYRIYDTDTVLKIKKY